MNHSPVVSVTAIWMRYFLTLLHLGGLILDVRNNGGGNLTNSERIAARFTNEKVLTGYIQHKT